MKWRSATGFRTGKQNCVQCCLWT